jgi:long-subunit fatty acid transport protein
MVNGCFPHFFKGIRLSGDRVIMGYLVKFICAAGVVLSPAAAQASGFALREYSAAGQGNAFAGATASAEDITFMAFNPAGLTLHPGEHASAGATAILPKATFSKTRATTVLGGTIGGGTGGDGFGKAALAPSVFYSRQMSENVFAGASLTVPFGLATNYDPDWVGRYHSIKSDIRTYNFNPVTVAGRRRAGRLYAGRVVERGGFRHPRYCEFQ